MTTRPVLPLMECGHTAQGIRDSDQAPVCVICIGTGGPDDPATRPARTEPDLTNRQAECHYCHRKVPSSTSLAFFNHRPDRPTDDFFDGCLGWD